MDADGGGMGGGAGPGWHDYAVVGRAGIAAAIYKRVGKQDSSFGTFATITVTVTDKTNTDFELTLFTSKSFTPNLEVQNVS